MVDGFNDDDDDDLRPKFLQTECPVGTHQRRMLFSQPKCDKTIRKHNFFISFCLP